MKRLRSLLLFAALIGSATPFLSAASSQDEGPGPETGAPLDPEAFAKAFSDSFDAGIAAFNSGEYEAGFAAFGRCLELVPQDSTCAYNMACGYSLKGDLDSGLEWLQNAADWGFGDAPANIEHCEKDTDLSNLQADERFAGVVQSMKDRNAAIEAYWSTPLIHVPASLKDVEKIPVLVVFHDAGETKEEVFKRGWKEACDELGMALVVPSGMLPAGLDITKGAAWFKDIGAYVNGYWTFEKSVTKGFDALKAQGKKLDRGQVYAVGTGQGGFVGLTASVCAPSLYGGAVCFDSAVMAGTVSKKAKRAKETGFKAALYVSDSMFGVPPEDLDEACRMMGGALQNWGIGEAIQRMERTENMHASRITLAKTKLTAWRQAAAAESLQKDPVEAGSGK